MNPFTISDTLRRQNFFVCVPGSTSALEVWRVIDTWSHVVHWADVPHQDRSVVIMLCDSVGCAVWMHVQQTTSLQRDSHTSEHINAHRRDKHTT